LNDRKMKINKRQHNLWKETSAITVAVEEIAISVDSRRLKFTHRIVLDAKTPEYIKHRQRMNGFLPVDQYGQPI
jgi:hypothetical protein